MVPLLPTEAICAELAITVDDFSIRTSPVLNIDQRDQRFLDALAKHKVKAGVFVTCKYLENKKIRKRLSAWDVAGHLIANHSYNHWNYNKTSFHRFSGDILKCDQELSGFSSFAKLFRFPFLKAGDTADKRDLIQGFLKKHGYRNGYVTIDTSDWYISDRLESRLRDHPKADITGYRDYYLNHMWDRAQYYEALGKKHWKKNIKHTLLIHHNLLNSLFLDDLLQMFKEKGWRFLDAQTAFRDPIFDENPKTVPSGESIVWAIARAAEDPTIRAPGEDGKYERDQMADLGL